MQNMKNAVLVLTAFLLLFPYKLMAENKVISIEDGWNIENDRSISFAPQLSIDEQNIYIDRKSTRLNSSHMSESRMPSSA